MARRRKKSTLKKIYSIELTGTIFILFGIIAFGLGPLGLILKKGVLFLAGEFWYLILLIIIVIGTHMLFKRTLPNLLSQRQLGIYLLIFSLLTFQHLEFTNVSSSLSTVSEQTYNNCLKRTKTIMEGDKIFSSGDSSIKIGGGLVGSVTSSLLVSAVGMTGTKIVSIIFLILSIILIFNITVLDIIRWFKNYFNSFEKDEKEKKKKKKEIVVDDDGLVEIKDDEKEDVKEDKKIVITSIDELKEKTSQATPTTIPPATLSLTAKEEVAEGVYRLPKLDLLSPTPKNKKNSEESYIKENIKKLESVLKDFEINGKVVEIHIGPAVTEYEIAVPKGTRINKIVNINKEIALALAAKDVRIQAPIPGKSTIGIEIPNQEIATVGLREVLEETSNVNGANKLIVALGKDIMGKPIVADLTAMPHLLVAGSTGSGKSVCINSILISLLMRYKPNEVKILLIDPKKVELSNYNGIPHLECPVINNPKKASVALQRIVSEMEKRYNTFSEVGVKNIASYNNWVEKENKKKNDNNKKMYYIVVVIDELADLMVVASKEVEASIMRITQLARAAGIHLIVATQRPSTDIITGVIKNNIPSRIAFSVSSQIDSRTILDQGGAEKLLGKGDMLFAPMGENVPIRIQGCFISDNDINKIISYTQTQGSANYNTDYAEEIHTSSAGVSNDSAPEDPMYDEIVDFAVDTGKISASLIQRRFRVGYNRAARIIDLLEARGIIGPPNGSKPREVLYKKASEENIES
ncbi:MAG: DNA translocase FtsK [Mollicutes bacterium]|nr:DNA translocase FtsK [Mollicutes bacterium]